MASFESPPPPENGDRETFQLYPAQAKGVERFLGSRVLHRPRRLIWGWKTGCGKTAGALTVLERIRPKSCIIVCPAIVRNHWLAEMQKFCTMTTLLRSAIIEYGRDRKLSKVRDALRAQAYAAHIRIVSYDLLHELIDGAADLIILDETHHLAQPLSRQSKAAAGIIKCNPKADILALTATPIPTEVKQLWNVLRLLFGESEWGPPSKSGDVSWRFQYRYCKIETDHFGTKGYGLNPANEAELRRRVAQRMHTLSREDIRDDLPPLDVHVYQLPKLRGTSGLADALLDWARELPGDVSHRVVMVRHRALAKHIHLELLGPDAECHYIDGNTTLPERHALLRRCAMASKATLVCTYESISEGVRLMWAQQVAIAEWPQSPGRMAQLLGRFNSVASDNRPCVNLMSDPDSYGATQTLLTRTVAMMTVLGTGTTEQAIETLMRECTDRDLTADDWSDFFNQQRDSAWDDADEL